jgi:hypothetical protein
MPAADQRSVYPSEEQMTKKPYPKFMSDDEEQAFLDAANLEDYDLTAGAVPMREWLVDCEDRYKDARVNLRLPKAKRKAALAEDVAPPVGASFAPLPPAAVALFDESLGVVVVAVASPPGCPVPPFAPVTVTSLA